MKFLIPAIRHNGPTKKNDTISYKKDNILNEKQAESRKKYEFLNENFKKMILSFTFIVFEVFNEKKIGKIITPSPAIASEINTTNLRIIKEDLVDENFLFSKNTTQKTNIESEIEEIEDDEFRYQSWKNTQIGLAIGGSGIGMWFAYKGLNAWEKWMKDQEQKDIEEEIEMTGTYINPGAGNVDASIDPVTGKKIVIKTEKKSIDENEEKE